MPFGGTFRRVEFTFPSCSINNISEAKAFANSFRTSRSNRLPEVIDVARNLLRESEFSRDQLPYTPEFVRLKKKFTKLSRRSLDDSEVWQLLTRAGKRGGGWARNQTKN